MVMESHCDRTSSCQGETSLEGPHLMMSQPKKIFILTVPPECLRSGNQGRVSSPGGLGWHPLTRMGPSPAFSLPQL